MNVHIALLGRTIDPILKGFQYYSIDKLFVLHSRDTEEFKFRQTAEQILARLENVGFKNTCLVEVNPFDMNDIIEKIVKVAETEKESTLYINITGGTNLMAGAACSASFFIGAKAYYVLDEKKLPKNSTLEKQIIELPTPIIPYARTIQIPQLKILTVLLKHNGLTSNRQLRYELKTTPQRLSYNIKELEKKGFIKTERGWPKDKTSRDKPVKEIDRRVLTISITNSGKLVASWTSSWS